MLSLPIGENVPMIAMISRLVSHKGFDIVRSAFNDILRDNVQFVVLGTGDAEHENFFRHMQSVYGDRVRSIIAFNKDMAQKIYAGADIFLMPSKSEPCGLSQMMALRYGTIPVVRACGGLRDSIFDCGTAIRATVLRSTDTTATRLSAPSTVRSDFAATIATSGSLFVTAQWNAITAGAAAHRNTPIFTRK